MNKFNGIEKFIFSDMYVILEKYVNCEDSYELWVKVIDECKMVCKRYDNHPLANDLAVAVMSDLEKRITKKEFKGKSLEYWETVKQRALIERAKNKTS